MAPIEDVDRNVDHNVDRSVDHQARWLAQAASASLRAAARVNVLGLVLALVDVLLAGIMLTAGSQWLWLGALCGLAALGQLVLLIRIEIDRGLFLALSRMHGNDDLRAMDDAMIALGWISPAEATSRPPRPMADRARGAGRFLKLAAALAAWQWLAAMLILFARLT
ncbi:hypothetical protein [Cupriavidus pampae]|uniref:Uncharacterized protein n=1 Tax=Cupriavidus pampae TaxID=659251 RepID=A0ABN7YV18_9BURK|nr:hypothetical protein [Cupriavidus pampae]CAG9177324.1 hypothetical protein LMG32289_03777 [Cupriavidus pampae]